ncbi:MAG: hypothetical protein GY772_13080 [bacterium]|nr:hypothetical protein [bacterium]
MVRRCLGSFWEANEASAAVSPGEASGGAGMGGQCARLVGVVAVEAWALLAEVLGPHAEAQAALLALRHPRSAGMGLCSRRFVVCAAVAPETPQWLPEGWAGMTGAARHRWAAENCRGVAFRLTRPGEWPRRPEELGAVDGFAALVEAVGGAVSAEHRGRLCSIPLWERVGRAVVGGAWPVLVVPVLRRCAEGRPEAEVFVPPRLVRRAYLAWVAEHGVGRRLASVTSSAVVEGDGRSSRTGCVVRFRPDHVVQALRCTRHLRSQGNRAFLADTLAFALGPQSVASAAQRWLEAHGVQLPSPTCLLRARPRLDVAVMLLRRQWYTANEAVFRFVAFDASPQQSGLEVFAAEERVLRQCDVAGDRASVAASTVTRRRLPLVALGQGRASRADKTMAHIHQTFLDYGEDEATFARAFRDVRQCLSDMGAEFGIGSAGDVRAEYLQGQCGASGAGAVREHLFPAALEVPGSQHITDVCLRQTLCALDWWPRWQAQAKAVCQFLASANHREKLRELLLAGQCAQCDSDAADASLRQSCERFAAWRWGTVRAATRGLLRMEAAVRAVCGPMQSFQALGVKEDSAAVVLLEVAKEERFWWEARAVRWLTEEFSSFSGWLRGCPCHEGGGGGDGLRPVPCQWKGCRAPEMSARVAWLVEGLDRRRRSLVAGQFGPVCVSLLGLALSRALSLVRDKFAWTEEVPYLVWQVAGAVAACRAGQGAGPWGDDVSGKICFPALECFSSTSLAVMNPFILTWLSGFPIVLCSAWSSVLKIHVLIISCP